MGSGNDKFMDPSSGFYSDFASLPGITVAPPDAPPSDGGSERKK